MTFSDFIIQANSSEGIPHGCTVWPITIKFSDGRFFANAHSESHAFTLITKHLQRVNG